MTDEAKIKIAKVYELVRRGEQGEQQAAEKALQRLLSKYNLSEEEVAKMHLKEYVFKYASDLDKRLLCQLFEYFFKDKYDGKLYTCTWRVKEISVEMEYLDYIQIESAYGYFKRSVAKICSTSYQTIQNSKIKKQTSSRTTRCVFFQIHY